MAAAIAFWDPVSIIMAVIPLSIYREGERSGWSRQIPD